MLSAIKIEVFAFRLIKFDRNHYCDRNRFPVPDSRAILPLFYSRDSGIIQSWMAPENYEIPHQSFCIDRDPENYFSGNSSSYCKLRIDRLYFMNQLRIRNTIDKSCRIHQHPRFYLRLHRLFNKKSILQVGVKFRTPSQTYGWPYYRPY